MIRKLFLLLLLISNAIFSKPKNATPSAVIDSSFFYAETAVNYKNYKVFDKALENANKAILFAKQTNNSSSLANGYYVLGSVYIDLKKYDLAIEQLIRAVSIFNSLEPTAKLALSYSNLGICYMNKTKFERAESYFSKANSVYENIGMANMKNRVTLQKTILYIEKKELEKAEPTLLKIANTPSSENNAKYQAEALFQLGLLEMEKSDFPLAISFLKKSFQIGKKEQEITIQLKVTKKLSEAYAKISQTDNSLLLLQKHLSLKDSLSNLNLVEKQTLISEQIKVDDVMRSNDKLEKDKKEQEKASKFSKLINILSIALITILSLLSLSLYKNNIIRNKSNELLREKNHELEEAKERTEKASQARAEFLSTVSHELRTPLNAINGISHILLEDNPKKSQIEYLKSLKFSGNYLLTYINEILEINRIESNNIELELINFNIRELLHNIQNSLKEQASQNNTTFQLIIDKQIPEILIGDPTKLSQVFINLINNAIKFTANGSVTVTAQWIAEKESNCSIHFEVKDTGIGIPEDKQEQIFESFAQGSVEINRKYGGTGLGLTIVKRLVALMGGEIKVKSKINEGSQFMFELDFKIGKIQIASNENAIIDDAIFRNKKILLVEDNKINQMITKKILQKKEMVVELCETGEDAIQFMQNNKYDIALMDVHLPGINGTVATQEIRKFDTATPIIALTAISLHENREMLLSFGMTDVITKPFNPDNFYKILENNLLKSVSQA